MKTHLNLQDQAPHRYPAKSSSLKLVRSQISRSEDKVAWSSPHLSVVLRCHLRTPPYDPTKLLGPGEQRSPTLELKMSCILKKLLKFNCLARMQRQICLTCRTARREHRLPLGRPEETATSSRDGIRQLVCLIARYQCWEGTLLGEEMCLGRRVRRGQPQVMQWRTRRTQGLGVKPPGAPLVARRR